MTNLQLNDTLDGGHFVVDRNDYKIDEGIYSELYACIFGTASVNWWADGAFDTIAPNVSSNTGIALKNNGTTTRSNLNVIKKAVNDDLDRFMTKNPNIEVSKVEVGFWSNTILIIIEIVGYNQAYNFIYQKTKENIVNANWQTY